MELSSLFGITQKTSFELPNGKAHHSEPRMTLKMFAEDVRRKTTKITFFLCGRDGDNHLCSGLISKWCWTACFVFFKIAINVICRIGRGSFKTNAFSVSSIIWTNCEKCRQLQNDKKEKSFSIVVRSMGVVPEECLERAFCNWTFRMELINL